MIRRLSRRSVNPYSSSSAVDFTPRNHTSLNRDSCLCPFAMAEETKRASDSEALASPAGDQVRNSPQPHLQFSAPTPCPQKRSVQPVKSQ